MHVGCLKQEHCRTSGRSKKQIRALFVMEFQHQLLDAFCKVMSLCQVEFCRHFCTQMLKRAKEINKTFHIIKTIQCTLSEFSLFRMLHILLDFCLITKIYKPTTTIIRPTNALVASSQEHDEMCIQNVCNHGWLVLASHLFAFLNLM